MNNDPESDRRALIIAQQRQRIAHKSYGSTANWNNLKPDE